MFDSAKALKVQSVFLTVPSTVNCYLLVLCIQEGYSGVTGYTYREVCATTALEMFKYRKSFPKFQDVCIGT